MPKTTGIVCFQINSVVVPCNYSKRSTVALIFCLNFLVAQSTANLKIDGDSVLLSSGVSLPFWVNSGQLIELIGNSKKVSVFPQIYK